MWGCTGRNCRAPWHINMDHPWNIISIQVVPEENEVAKRTMEFRKGLTTIMLVIAFVEVEGSPVGWGDANGMEKFVKSYDSLRQPLKEFMYKTEQIANALAKEKGLKNVRIQDDFKESCERHIGKVELKHAKDRQKRLIYVMKIYQELVKQLQIIQMRESASNKGRFTMFTQEYRGIEFMLRNFVETKLRNAAKTIVGNGDERKNLPSYSIGNSHAIQMKDVTSDKPCERNLETLKAVLFCSKMFLYNDIVAVAGRDRFMEEKSLDESLKGVQGISNEENTKMARQEGATKGQEAERQAEIKQGSSMSEVNPLEEAGVLKRENVDELKTILNRLKNWRQEPGLGSFSEN